MAEKTLEQYCNMQTVISNFKVWLCKRIFNGYMLHVA